MSEGGRTFTCTLPPLPPGSTSAIYIPTPRFSTVVLSSMEILVIGGWVDDSRVNTVYKGTLTLN